MKKANELTYRQVIFLAVASGLSVANIYYNQPLLAEIAKTFQTSAQATGMISNSSNEEFLRFYTVNSH